MRFPEILIEASSSLDDFRRVDELVFWFTSEFWGIPNVGMEDRRLSDAVRACWPDRMGCEPRPLRWQSTEARRIRTPPTPCR